MSIANDRCKHCGQTIQRMMLLAMLQDAGASAGLDADLCPERTDGGQHEFVRNSAEPVAA